MKFILNKDKLTVENEESANSGSVQYYEVEVEHDESWDELIIEAVIVPKEGGALIFDDAESIAEIDNKIYIDRELSGSYAIGFKGFTIENEVKVYQISTNLQGVYFNEGAGQIITTNSIPKPTEWEIYVAQIEAIANRASASADDAQTSADNAETSAENAQTSAETATEQAQTATEQAEEATRQAESAKDDADRAEQAREGFETEVENATRDFNTNATNKTNTFNENADTKTTEYNTNHTNKLKDYNDNSTEKLNTYNTNHTNKLKTYNDNHTEKLESYNTNDTNKTRDYNDNATEKTNTFNTNATNKTNAFNDNATNKTTAFNENATSKTTDFNDNAEDKTTEFNEVVDEAKDDIEEIAPMLQEKMAKIPSMMKDKTATGTSIHTEDSALWYGKLNFEGFSRQETTTGANKMAFTERSVIGGQSEVDYICNSQGQVTMTGTAVKAVGFTYNQDAVVLNAGTYRVKVIGNYTGVLFTRTNPSGQISLNSNGEKTITIEEDNTEFKILCNTQIGTTYDCDFYITLTPGETATTERYTGGMPKPNINYPSNIRNLTGNVGTEQTGVNKLNINNVYRHSPQSSSILQYTINDNVLDMKAKGTQGAQMVGYLVSGLDSSKTYTIAFKSKKIVAGVDGSPCISCRLYGSMDGETFGSIIKSMYNNNPVVNQEYSFIETITGYKYYRAYFYNNTSTPVTVGEETEYYDIMFVEGEYTAETMPEYEPYKEHTITFPLGTEKMYQGSTLTDNGIKHIRKKIVFDGTENWSMYSDTPGKYYCTTKHFGRETGYENPSTFKCTHFTPAIGTAATNAISSTKFATYINMDTTTISDLSSFKTWLSNNNVLVEYLSAEPEIIPYTEAQQEAYDELQNLETYQYVNNIELAANEETNMTLDYKKDIQMQIAEETSKLTQAIVALGGVVE